MAVLVAIACAVRLHGIARDYWLMHDQIRDWDLVQSSFGSLPSAGTPRTGGGHHLGPAYYHWLWLSRVTLAPLLGNLPHVAGVTVTIAEVVSVAALAMATVRLGVPLLGASALGVLLGSNPYEAALARAGWNPALALAFSNFGLALFLGFRARWSPVLQGALTLFCWGAVEMHMAAFPLAVALGVASVFGTAPQRGLGGRVRLVATSAVVVLVMQLPALLDAGAGDPAAPSSLETSIGRVFARPVTMLSIRGLRFVFVRGAEQLFLATPLPGGIAATVLVAGILLAAWATWRRRLEPAVVLVVHAPLLVAAAAFSIFTEALNAYWLAPLFGVYGLAVVLPLAALRSSRPRTVLGAACLGLTILALPARWTHFRMDHRYPTYAHVVAAASQVARDGTPVRALIGPQDAVRPTTSSPLVRWLGGTLSEESEVVVHVGRDGRVSRLPPVDDARRAKSTLEAQHRRPLGP